MFALLVCDAAAGLAGGLAGCLALAAAAVLCALAKAACFDGLNVTHDEISFQRVSADIRSVSVPRGHDGSYHIIA